MKESSEYLKQINEALWNISEDMACEIINAYYNQCARDDEPCIDNKGRNIYNLMDSKQAVAAVKGYGFAEVSNVFSQKTDWILCVDWDLETKKPVMSTEVPSVVLDNCLRNIICSYCYDPMAYPTFFRTALAQPLSQLCALHL